MFRFGFIGIALLLGVLSSPVAAQSDKVPPALLQYVRDAQKIGMNPTTIRQNALKVGWPQETVDEALDLIKEGAPKPAPDSAEKAPEEKKSTPPADEPAKAPTEPRKTASPGAAAANPAASDDGGAGTPKPGEAVPDDYEIGEGDVLHISVWGEPLASVPAATVRTDGKISIPLIKEVMIAGLTPAQAEAQIKERLSKIIKEPDVTVIVSQINSKKIYLIGAIRKEGPLKYTYRMTVLQAISEAGGLTDYAKRKNIYVLHVERGVQYKIPFNYAAVLRGENIEQNIVLSPGDSIIVPQ